MTTTRVLYSGSTSFTLYINSGSWLGLVDELVVRRPFHRTVRLPLSEVWRVDLQGVDEYTDQRPLRLKVWARGSESYSWRLKRYRNTLPLEDFAETLRNLSKDTTR